MTEPLDLAVIKDHAGAARADIAGEFWLWLGWNLTAVVGGNTGVTIVTLLTIVTTLRVTLVLVHQVTL